MPVRVGLDDADRRAESCRREGERRQHRELPPEQRQLVELDDGLEACLRTLSGTSECTMTTVLSDGQITVAGPFDEVGINHLAVTGGTGAYTNVRGSLTVYRAGFFQLDLTYDLSLG